MGKFINFGSGDKFNKNKLVKFLDFQAMGSISTINYFGYTYANSSIPYSLGIYENGEIGLPILVNVDNIGDSFVLIGDKWVSSYGDNFKAECRFRVVDTDKGSAFFGITSNSRFYISSLGSVDTGIYIENGEIYPIEAGKQINSIGTIETTNSDEFDKYYTVKVLYDFNKSPQCDLYFIDYTGEILYHNSFDLTASENLAPSSIHAIARNTISDENDTHTYYPCYIDYILIEKKQRR